MDIARQERRRAEVRQYSTAVRWMKVLLPVAAIALIVLIFLTGTDRQAVVTPSVGTQTAALAAGLKLDNPRFAGVTDDGDPFMVTADWALPDGAMPDRIDLEQPKGEMRLGSGTTLKMRADTGQMLRTDEHLDLVGGVELTTSDGYVARADRVELDLDQKTITVPGQVNAEGPRGRIRADSMRATRAAPDARDVTMHFSGNVRMTLLPKGQK
ncbi:MAG: LPS export ABC transporter periplasmic protein LptC [Pseudomonadota bacterium]